eukprot:6186498-Pleurochrysis_carterae.AAC.1
MNHFADGACVVARVVPAAASTNANNVTLQTMSRHTSRGSMLRSKNLHKSLIVALTVSNNFNVKGRPRATRLQILLKAPVSKSADEQANQKPPPSAAHDDERQQRRPAPRAVQSPTIQCLAPYTHQPVPIHHLNLSGGLRCLANPGGVHCLSPPRRTASSLTSPTLCAVPDATGCRSPPAAQRAVDRRRLRSALSIAAGCAARRRSPPAPHAVACR